jgi:hypothetical protein
MTAISAQLYSCSAVTIGMVYCSFVDLHHFDVDPDLYPTFNFDANPDPDPTPSFHMSENLKFFFTGMAPYIFFLSHQCHRCHTFYF